MVEELKGFYLAHSAYQRKIVREWEIGFEARNQISLTNPFYDDNELDPEREVIQLVDEGKIEPNYVASDEVSKKILDYDLNLITLCRGLVAIIGYDFPGDEERGAQIGTPIEAYYSSQILHKPTYIITNTLMNHPFLKAIATKMFSSLEEFEEFIKNGEF